MKKLCQLYFVTALLTLISCESGPSLIINGENSYSFTNQGGTQILTFTCNRDWFVSSSESWCAVSPSSGVASEGSNRASIVCEPNLTYDARSCILTVNIEGVRETISIEQSAAEGLILSQTSFDVSNAAQSIEVDVQANVEYTVTIASDCEKWISRTSSKGLTSTKLYFSIAENTQYDNREGKITIAQKNGSLSRIITIRQAQKDGLFIDTQEYEVSEENQSVFVNVKANVEYEALPEVEWIKYVQTKALKESTATLSIEANNSTFKRSGRVLFKQKDGSLSHMVSITQQARPELKTETASTIALFSAWLNGSLAVEFALEVTSSVWFLYSSSASSVETLISEGTKVVSTLEGNGRFTGELTGLSLATTYYYIACATVNGRQYYGDVISFTTSDFTAEVSTSSASDIDYFSCQLSGTLKTQNADSFSKDVYFLYSSSVLTIDELITDGTRLSSSLSDYGVFTARLENLDYGSTYYYAACAKVLDRECFGDVRSFSTQSFSANVKTLPAAGLSLYKASLMASVSFENTGSFPKTAGFIYAENTNDLDELISNGSRIEADIDIDNRFLVNLSKLKCGTKYGYVAYVKVYDKVFYGEVETFSTVQLPNGAIDMGLSVAWSSCNIGASKPEEVGDLYAWGETEPKAEYYWGTYKWGNPDNKTLKKYNCNVHIGQVDNKTELDADDDAARVKMGGSWRMPTLSDLRELYDNCTWVWMTYNGIDGCTLTSKVNGNSIFLPALGPNAGDYWSTALYTDGPSTNSFVLSFTRNWLSISFSAERYQGIPIRAVTE